MKYKQQIAALMLSFTLITGMALPAFAVNESSDTQAVTTEETQITDDAQDSETAETSDADESTNAASEEADAETESDASADTEESSGGMPTISVSAKASILVNAETGEIIHADNETEKEYPASTTKIMTALLVLENCNLDDTVTMTEDDFNLSDGASTSGLQVGEEITIENLLYCLLLPSGNEAANALARVTGGSVEDFVQMMNDRATELGCVNTHFTNANGLHDDDHYTCAYDLYLIAQQAMQYDTFATIVNTAQKKLPATNMNEERVIYTTNDLILSSSSSIYYDNCYGIKTGHTSEAGYCLVSYATKGSCSYYSVVLGAEAGTEYAGSFTETKSLFEWAFDNFSLTTATEAGAAVTECTVRLGKGTDHVTLVTADNVTVLIPDDADIEDLTVEINVDDSYDAPIAKGETLGTVTYSYEGMECATADLIALSEVKRSAILYLFDQIANFFRLTAVRVIIIGIILVFVIYVILSVIAGRNRRNKQREKNKRKRQNQRNKK